MVISWWAFGIVVVLWVIGDNRRAKEIRGLQIALESKGYELENMEASRDSYRNEAKRADKGLQHLEELTNQAWTDEEPGEASQKAHDIYQRVIDVRTYVRDESADPNYLPWKH
ncbi:hypothetical protein Q6670_004097 [Salmonella enterica]|nr:hypothetical protein [Salmonella enterica]